MSPLKQKNIDQLVLGCTHYPFLTDEINKIVDGSIKVVETAIPVTTQLKKKLASYELLTEDGIKGNSQFYSTNASPELEKTMSNLWQNDIQLRALPQ